MVAAQQGPRDEPVGNLTGRSVWTLTVVEKMLYGVGEIPITVSMVIFGLFIVFFYGTVMGLPGTLVGIGSAAGLLFDALVDPYIGYRSDHTHGRMGRRHGYMLVGALTMGCAFWLLLSPPAGLSTTGLFLWLLVTTLIYRFAAALYRIPYLSLGAEVARDYLDRTRIVAIRSLFGLAGTLAAATLSFTLFFPNTVPGIDPKLDHSGYQSLGMASGFIMSLAGLAAVLGTWRWRLARLDAPAHSAAGFLAGFGTALRNRAFRRVWLSFTLFFLGVVLNATFAIHYFTWYAGIENSGILSRIQLAFYLGAFAGVVLWVRLARYVDKHVLCLIAIIGTAVLLALAVLLVGKESVFGSGNPGPLIVGHALAGLFASGLWVLPGAMVADVADDDEFRTGERREGLFFGLLNLGEKLAAGGAVLVAGVLLEHFVRLTDATVQTQTAVERIGLVYGVLPALVLAGAAVSLIGYRLGRETVRGLQTRLCNRPAGRP